MDEEKFIAGIVAGMKTAVKDVLVEIYKDSETRERLFTQLVQRYQQWNDDCQQEKQSAQEQLRTLQHREVDMQSNIEKWRAAFERGEKRIEQLEEMVNKLNVRIDQLEKARE